MTIVDRKRDYLKRHNSDENLDINYSRVLSAFPITCSLEGKGRNIGSELLVDEGLHIDFLESSNSFFKFVVFLELDFPDEFPLSFLF